MTDNFVKAHPFLTLIVIAILVIMNVVCVLAGSLFNFIPGFAGLVVGFNQIRLIKKYRWGLDK